MDARVQVQAVSEASRFMFHRNPHNFLFKKKCCFIIQFDVQEKLSHVVYVEGRWKLIRES